MSWVIVSPACPTCRSLRSAWPTVQTQGFRIIALDDATLSACTRDLLWALHVEELPAVHRDGVLRCGQNAVQWLVDQGLIPGSFADKIFGTTIPELQSLRALNPPGTNSVTTDEALLSRIRSDPGI
jgi:hypothetical protein